MVGNGPIGWRAHHPIAARGAQRAMNRFTGVSRRT